MVRTAFLGLLLLTGAAALPQEDNIEKLVEQLGDPSLDVRERAVEKLRKDIPRAFEALKKAAQSSDAEVRLRAKELLVEYEHDVAQAALEKRERIRTLRLVTVEAKDRPVREVVASLGEQTLITFKTDKIDLERRVSLSLRDAPLLQGLHGMGLACDSGMIHFNNKWDGGVELLEAAAPAGVKYAAGAHFAFKARAWQPHVKTLGTIFETELTSDLPEPNSDNRWGGFLSWEVAGIKTDREYAVETCDVHSPRLVYVARPDLKDPRVTLRGTLRWFCAVPIEFKDPRGDETWRSGDYEISVHWPKIAVRSAKPVVRRILTLVLTDSDVSYTLREPDRSDNGRIGVGGGSGSGGRYGGRYGGEERAWCGCVGTPTKKERVALETMKEIEVQVHTLHALKDISLIKLTFYKPMEEPFEILSDPIK